MTYVFIIADLLVHSFTDADRSIEKLHFGDFLDLYLALGMGLIVRPVGCIEKGLNCYHLPYGKLLMN